MDRAGSRVIAGVGRSSFSVLNREKSEVSSNRILDSSSGDEVQLGQHQQTTPHEKRMVCIALLKCLQIQQCLIIFIIVLEVWMG